jgi:acetate---CoA ligase (ADP-forming)
MVTAGLELLLGVENPPDGMPVVVVAAGGVNEAIVADRTLATLPLGPGAAAAALDRLRSARLIAGFRGAPALDREAVLAAIERIALLPFLAPQIREVDVNPLAVHPTGVTALDVKVRIAVDGEAGVRTDPLENYERALG